MIPRRSIVPLVTLAAAVLLWQDTATFDTRGYPAAMVEAARLAERRCTKCHSLARVVTSELVGDDWTDVVRDMAKKEKSGISEREAATIAGFLAFRSTKGATGARGTDSRPGAASRPTVFGGAVAYPPATASVFASASLPASAVLPATLELGMTRVVVKTASARSDADGLLHAAATVTVDEVEGEIELARTGARIVPGSITLRSWSIGPYSFRLTLALYQAEPAAPAAPRGDFVLALVVVREVSRQP
jgi:hypothetical protein